MSELNLAAGGCCTNAAQPSWELWEQKAAHVVVVIRNAHSFDSDVCRMLDGDAISPRRRFLLAVLLAPPAFIVHVLVCCLRLRFALLQAQACSGASIQRDLTADHATMPGMMEARK